MIMISCHFAMIRICLGCNLFNTLFHILLERLLPYFLKGQLLCVRLKNRIGSLGKIVLHLLPYHLFGLCLECFTGTQHSLDRSKLRASQTATNQPIRIFSAQNFFCNKKKYLLFRCIHYWKKWKWGNSYAFIHISLNLQRACKISNEKYNNQQIGDNDTSRRKWRGGGVPNALKYLRPIRFLDF